MGSGQAELTVFENFSVLTVSNDLVKVIINTQTGNIQQLSYNQKPCIVDELHPDFWRVPTDNDYGNGMPGRLKIWRDADKTSVVKSMDHEKTADGVHITVKRFLKSVSAEFNSLYIINEKGEVEVQNEFILAPNVVYKELPRIGMQTKVPGKLAYAEWYGRGPHENYIDRKTSARFGVWSSEVEELHHAYIRPQENAYRTDTRWVSFTDESGTGFLIQGDTPLCFNAQYYSRDQYCNEPRKDFKHTYDLVKEENITLNIDHKQMGVGGDNSWGARTHEEYRVLPHEYYYSFTIRPVK